MADVRLLNYIIRRYQEGHPLLHIKNRLIKKGWGPEEIHAALGEAILMTEDPEGHNIVLQENPTATDTQTKGTVSESLSLDQPGAQQQEKTDYAIEKITSEIELEDPSVSQKSLDLEIPTLLVEAPAKVQSHRFNKQPFEKIELMPLDLPIPAHRRTSTVQLNSKKASQLNSMHESDFDTPSPIPKQLFEYSRLFIVVALFVAALTYFTYSVLYGSKGFSISKLLEL